MAPLAMLEGTMPRVLTHAHLEQFRNRLCDVAARLYFEMGYGDFNMRDLAARVGVSPMTPYRYFGDKDGILAAVRARGAARLADRLEAAVPQGSAEVVQAYIRFAMEEAAYYRLIFDLSQPHAPLAELARQECRIPAAMAAAIACGRAAPDAERLARSLWTMLHGAICLVVSGKMSEAELGELASGLVLMVLGIRRGFVVPSLQETPAREVPARPALSAVRTTASHIAAE